MDNEWRNKEVLLMLWLIGLYLIQESLVWAYEVNTQIHIVKHMTMHTYTKM